MRTGQTAILSIWIYLLVLLLPQQASAVADAILGVDSTTGVAEVLTPEDAATLIGGTGLDAQFDATGGNQITGADENKPLEILGSGGQASYGLSIDRTSAGESRWRCKEAAGLNKCNYYRQLDSGFKGGFKDSTGTVKWEFDEATGKVTVATMDATTANVALTLFDERHFPVATCQNTTTYANFDLPTTNSPTAACNTGTNTQKAYLAFDDSTDQSFQDHFIVPTNLTQIVSVDVHFRWKATATSGAVGWCAQLIRVPDGSTSDPAFPAQSASTCVSDTAKSTTLQENSAVITGVTCANCAPGDHVYVRISRDADGSAVTDDMIGSALLLMYGRVWKVVL